MALLQNTMVQPLHFGSQLIQELGHAIHPLVHAVEQPIDNVVRNTTNVVSGVFRLNLALLAALPYAAVAFMGWTFVGNFFPREKRRLEASVGSAVRRIRRRLL